MKHFRRSKTVSDCRLHLGIYFGSGLDALFLLTGYFICKKFDASIQLVEPADIINAIG